MKRTALALLILCCASALSCTYPVRCTPTWFTDCGRRPAPKKPDPPRPKPYAASARRAS